MPPLKKNEKIMLTLIGVSVVVFVVMDPYYFIWRKNPAAAGKAAGGAPGGGTGGTAAAAAPTAAGAAPQKSAPGKVTYEPITVEGWGRDPFQRTRPQFDQTWKLTDFKLGAISVRGGDRYALINSKVLRQGEEIGGMRVERIERDRVILSAGGRSYTLSWEGK